MRVSDGNKLLVSSEQISGLKGTYQAIFQQSMDSQASSVSFEPKQQVQEVAAAEPQNFGQAVVQDSATNIFDAPFETKSEQPIASGGQGENLEDNIFNVAAPSATGSIDDMNAPQVQTQVEGNSMTSGEFAAMQNGEEIQNKTIEERLVEIRRKRDDALFRATIAIEDANGFTAEVDRLEQELRNNGKAVVPDNSVLAPTSNTIYQEVDNLFAPAQTEQVNVGPTMGM